MAAGQLIGHEAANFFESEARVLGAGDDVQRDEHCGRIDPIAVLARQSGARGREHIDAGWMLVQSDLREHIMIPI